MKGLYDFSLTLSTALLKLFSGFSPRLKKLVTGRKDSFRSLSTFVEDNSKGIVWFHVASLGEYEQAKPVIHELKQVFPDKAVALTFFSPSGYEHVAKKPQPNIDFITYLPFDTADNAQKWVGLMKPEMVFFVKYDLWANFILSVKKRKIPLFLFSASLRPEQIYFKSYGGFFKKILFSFDHIFTQNKQSIELLKNIGYRDTTLAGDTRYDNVKAIRENPKRFADIDAFVGEKQVIVIGSAWEEDMALVIPFINSNTDDIYLIAPHDIDAAKIADWQGRINVPSLKYSQLNDGKAHHESVLFIDNIGMLSSLYQYAKIAYVGGAFGKGLHNILEPLAFGIPVMFGKLKKTSKFPEASISRTYGCGFEVGTADEFQKAIADLKSHAFYQAACKAAEHLVEDNLGSAKKIVQHVQKIMEGI